jgi:hypothetical protein
MYNYNVMYMYQCLRVSVVLSVSVLVLVLDGKTVKKTKSNKISELKRGLTKIPICKNQM